MNISSPAMHNFEDIIKEVDGVIIARGYLTVHVAVEQLIFKVKDMINKCHEQLKPVMVSCNLLESMITSLIPTIPEIGEISNLVNQYIDCFILSAETSFGEHPIESIETLSRIIKEVERYQVSSNENFNRNTYIESKNQRHASLNIIVYSAIEAAYKMKAKLIISFTNSGNSALKLSKLRPPCPVISICNQVNIARILNFLSGIQGKYQPSSNQQDVIIKRIVEKFKQQKILQSGDFIIITCSTSPNFNNTDNMRIHAVE